MKSLFVVAALVLASQGSFASEGAGAVDPTPTHSYDTSAPLPTTWCLRSGGQESDGIGDATCPPVEGSPIAPVDGIVPGLVVFPTRAAAEQHCTAGQSAQVVWGLVGGQLQIVGFACASGTVGNG